MLQIIRPIALVARAVGMRVDAVTVRLVVCPFTFIFIPMHMPESALSICFVVPPKTFVPRTVGPRLHPLPMSHFFVGAGKPLADIARSVFELVLLTRFNDLFAIGSFNDIRTLVLVPFEHQCFLYQLGAAAIAPEPSLDFDYCLELKLSPLTGGLHWELAYFPVFRADAARTI